LIELLKDDFYRWIGAILIGLGIFFVLLSLMGATIWQEEMEALPEAYYGIIWICTAVFLLPGIAIFAWGWKLGQEERELEKLAGYLKSYRRINSHTLARKLGKTEYETEHLIAECVRLGLVKGYFDRSSDEFFTYQSVFEEIKRRDKCPNCGAAIDARVLVGESYECRFCRTKFTPPPTAPPPPPSYPHPPPYPSYPSPKASAPSPLSQGPITTSVKCPSCSIIFDVKKQSGPYKITCPKCGSWGFMEP
jgi:predicted RNA-binding Zn-ribbon protein involved in translation (DUF1610 family)